MNKKLIVALIAVILMAAMLCTSCGGGTPKSLSGSTWACTYTAEQLKSMGAPDGYSVAITLTFTDATRVTVKMSALLNGQEEYSDDSVAEYTYSDGKLSMTSYGSTITGTVDGNTLTLEENGQKLVFKKK